MVELLRLFSRYLQQKKLKSLKGSFSRAGEFSDEVHLREVLGYIPVHAKRSTEDWETVHGGELSHM